MRKGITPIIAIIILLLITISLAAAAYTFLQGYFTGLTGNVIELSTQTCLGGTDVMGIVKNIGSSTVLVSDISVIDKSDGSSPTVTWTEVDNTANAITQIDVNGQGRLNIAGQGAGRHTYAVIVAGREYTLQVMC